MFRVDKWMRLALGFVFVYMKYLIINKVWSKILPVNGISWIIKDQKDVIPFRL